MRTCFRRYKRKWRTGWTRNAENTAQEKEEVQSGYILKCGPGYPLPSSGEGEEWNPAEKEPRYLPLQVRPGDLAIYMAKSAVEIKYDSKKYFIVPQNAILMVEREEF